MTKYVKRHEFWRIQYRKNRYMEHFSDSEIKNRHEIILDNLMRITIVDGKPKIALQAMDEQPQWIVKITHIYEELVLRGAPLPGPLANPDHKGFLDKISFDEPPTIFSHPEIKRGTFKYGQYEHLERILNDGIIRICPATHYGNSNYGYSIDDNEIEKFIVLNQGNSKIYGILNGFDISSFSKYKIKIPIKAKSDYFIFSLSNSFQYRHVYDYGYESMLVIKDRSEFVRRMREGFRLKLGNEFDIVECDVNYVDPFLPNGKTVFIAATMKDIKFAYQTEFRIIASPKRKIENLGEPIFLSIKPLKDIAEIMRFW